MSNTKDNAPTDGPKQGPLGDTRPTGVDPKPTKGRQPQEDVEDRPNVATVKPEDYPSVHDRAT